MFVKDNQHIFWHDSYINIKYFILIRINKKEEWSVEIKYQQIYKNITLHGVQVVESIENFEENIDVILMVGYDILRIDRSDQFTS